MSRIAEWAQRWGVSAEALADLVVTLAPECAPPPPKTGTSEAAVTSRVRLEAAGKGYTLWRNNVGALLDKRGIPVRFGLANDSAAMNAKLKSADWIGWQRVVVTPDMVGRTVALFASVEMKEAGWRYSGKGREVAQMSWAQLVSASGGVALMVSGEGELPSLPHCATLATHSTLLR